MRVKNLVLGEVERLEIRISMLAERSKYVYIQNVMNISKLQVEELKKELNKTEDTSRDKLMALSSVISDIDDVVRSMEKLEIEEVIIMK